MKRSEMIDFVHKKLDQAWGYDNDLSKSQLRFILELFECKGMLPPTNEEKSFQLLENGEMTYQVNEWESENV